MGSRRSSSTASQALITDFFQQERVTEPEVDEWFFYQTLITDFYSEREETVEVGQSVSEHSFTDSEFHSLLDIEPQTPISQLSLRYSDCTHVSETPENRVARPNFGFDSEVQSQMRNCLW